MTLDLTQSLPSHVRATSGRPVEDSTLMEVWQGLSAAIVDQIADNWAATTERYAKGRQEHYFSAEFLMGRALLNTCRTSASSRRLAKPSPPTASTSARSSKRNRTPPSVTVASAASPPASSTPAPPWTCPCAATASLPLRPVQAALRQWLPDRAPGPVDGGGLPLRYPPRRALPHRLLRGPDRARRPLRHRDHRLRHQERGHPAPVEGRAHRGIRLRRLQLPALHRRHRRP